MTTDEKTVIGEFVTSMTKGFNFDQIRERMSLLRSESDDNEQEETHSPARPESASTRNNESVQHPPEKTRKKAKKRKREVKMDYVSFLEN